MLYIRLLLLDDQVLQAMQDEVKRILIVDDDADIANNLADILDDIGYQTTTATSAARAMTIINESGSGVDCGFDLCLLDFKMPEIDGAQLLKLIRKTAPGLRAIMITAYAGDDGIQRALQAGTWKVLQKPVNIKTMLAVIAEAVA